MEYSFDKYTQVAEIIRNIISEYDTNFTSHSLDEVYFSLEAVAMKFLRYCSVSVSTDEWESPEPDSYMTSRIDHNWEQVPQPTTEKTKISLRLLRSAAVLILDKIRRRVRMATGGLTCSAGTSSNTLASKSHPRTNLNPLFMLTFRYSEQFFAFKDCC